MGFLVCLSVCFFVKVPQIISYPNGQKERIKKNNVNQTNLKEMAHSSNLKKIT